MTIADAIKEYRDRKGITQKQLAKRINKSERMIKRYEKGDTIPSIEILDEIFDKSMHELIYTGVQQKIYLWR